MALQELDLTIEYHPGKDNQRADALSRLKEGHAMKQIFHRTYYYKRIRITL